MGWIHREDDPSRRESPAVKMTLELWTDSSIFGSTMSIMGSDTRTTKTIHRETESVVEAVVGVEFKVIPQINTSFLVAFATRLSTKFPIVDLQPSLPPALDPATALAAPEPTMNFTFGEAPANRLWLTDRSGVFLLQLQNDRIVVNWRKLKPSTQYPRHDHLREMLEANFKELRRICDESGIVISATVTECSYVNAIDEKFAVDSLYPAAFSELTGDEAYYQFSTTRGISHSGEHTTVLNIAGGTGQVSTGVQDFGLNISARTAVMGSDKFFPVEALAVAHDCANSTFNALTAGASS